MTTHDVNIAAANQADAPARSGLREPAAALEQAVISTLAYSDVFGYPLTLEETHRYLHGVAADSATVRAALDTLVRDGRISNHGSLFALAGRERLFAQRRNRERIAQALWPQARRYARTLASIGTVTMVGVTGSLATGNPVDEADIDIMLITHGGTLWRTRGLARALVCVDRRFGGSLCVNYFRSERALELPARDLYTARELTQMVPLYGLYTYEALRRQNEWVRDELPNADGPPCPVEPVRPSRAARTLTRPALGARMTEPVERWESERKIHRYNETEFLADAFSPFSKEATGHKLAMKQQIERAHAARLAPEADHAPLRVLIGQSYHLKLDPKLYDEMRPYPPLGSLYAAAAVRDAGYDVSFFDAMLSTELSAWVSALDRHRPDVVVLFEDNFNYLTKMCLLRMREAAFAMIGAARETGARVAVCSSDATDNADAYIDAGAEFVIRGEGEQALVKLLDWLADPEADDRSALPSITYRNPDDELVSNARLPPVRALDTLPLPAWDLADLEKYARIWRHRHGHASINLVTTRGCPYHCNWCAKPIWGQTYNVRSPEHVAAELEQLDGLTDLDHVWFMDDIFGLKPRWVTRFADALESRDLSIRFKCLTRPDLLRREGEVEALKRAGCESVWIGAESGSQKILDAMEKGTRVEDIEDITRRLKGAGIRVGYFIQYGYPGETLADVKATIRLIRRMQPDELGVSVSYPLPGTKFYERVKDELGATQNWRDSDDLAMLFRGRFGTRFYRALHRVTHRELALRRTLAQLRDGTVFELPPRRRLRRLALLGLTSVTLPLGWLHVYALSVFYRSRVSSLPVALDQLGAATPSSQSHD